MVSPPPWAALHPFARGATAPLTGGCVAARRPAVYPAT